MMLNLEIKHPELKALLQDVKDALLCADLESAPTNRAVLQILEKASQKLQTLLTKYGSPTNTDVMIADIIEHKCSKLPRKASEGVYFELKPLKFSQKNSRWFVWVGERQGAPHFNRCASGKTQLEALTNLLNKPQPTKV